MCTHDHAKYAPGAWGGRRGVGESQRTTSGVCVCLLPLLRRFLFLLPAPDWLGRDLRILSLLPT